MVFVRVVRFAVEVIDEAAARSSVHRIAWEVAALESVAATPRTVRVSRLAVEVSQDTPPSASLHATRWEAAALEGVAVTDRTVRVIRFTTEVVQLTPSNVSLLATRWEAAVLQGQAVTSRTIRVVRLAVELHALRPPTATPRAFPSNFRLFAHNWFQQVEMETSYMTSVRRADTVAESRKGLWSKPVRNLSLRFTTCSEEEIDMLYVYLRNLVDMRGAAPLFQDFAPVTAFANSFDDVVFCNTEDKRFFSGQNVILIEYNVDFVFTGNFIPRTVKNRFTDRLEFFVDIGQDIVARRWIVVPVIDIDRLDEAVLQHATTTVGESDLNFQESIGPSTLPPVQTGLPDGFPVYDGLPIFTLEPNWVQSVDVTNVREGEFQQTGRGFLDLPQGERHRVMQEYNFLFERPEFFTFLRFFDTRLGRLRAFWHIDQESVWEVAAFDPNFVDIMPFGDFTEFQRELFPGGHIGVKFEDDHSPLAIVRDAINVTQIAGLWRITVTPQLPATLDKNKVRRVARARRMRFLNDSFRERWNTDMVCQVSTSLIELLNEGEVLVE